MNSSYYIIILIFFIRQLITGLSYYIFLAMRLKLYLQDASYYKWYCTEVHNVCRCITHHGNVLQGDKTVCFQRMAISKLHKNTASSNHVFPCLLQFSMSTPSFIFIGWHSLGEKIEAIRRMLSLLPPPMNAPSSVWRCSTLQLTRTVPSIKTCHCVT